MAEPTKPIDPQAQRRRLEQEIERLHQLIESLERSRRQAPWYLLFGVLAVPAFFVGGIWLAVAALFCGVCLSLIVLYLAGVRENEYRGELKDVEAALEHLRRKEAAA